MKRIAIFLILAVAGLCARAAVLTPLQQSYLQNRRICVKRDTTTLPGYVITTWHRNGKLDKNGVVTNKLQTIVGKEQHNPLQALLEQWKATAETWKTAATNTAARVDAVAETLRAKRAEYVKKRDTAVLPTTKDIYQAFIDQIDKWLAKLEAKKED